MARNALNLSLRAMTGVTLFRNKEQESKQVSVVLPKKGH